MGKKDRQLTEDELRLWREVVSDGRSKTSIFTGNLPPPSAAILKSDSRKSKPTPKQKPRTLVLSGVGKHEARAIKRGSLPIEDRIDLHGMTQAAAQSALTGFIQDSAERGLRCVLVITGKGAPKKETDEDLFMPRRPGVLRDATPGWLSASKLARHVIAYQPALPRDGGAGALYVLLRRG
jgi:DNA-nicking Smr family endonuclease